MRFWAICAAAGPHWSWNLANKPIEIPLESDSLVPVESQHRSRGFGKRGSHAEAGQIPHRPGRKRHVACADGPDPDGETLEVETIQEPSAPDSPQRLAHAAAPLGALSAREPFFSALPSFFFSMARPRSPAATAWAWWAPMSPAMRRSRTRCWTASTRPTP